MSAVDDKKKKSKFSVCRARKTHFSPENRPFFAHFTVATTAPERGATFRDNFHRKGEVFLRKTALFFPAGPLHGRRPILWVLHSQSPAATTTTAKLENLTFPLSLRRLSGKRVSVCACVASWRVGFADRLRWRLCEDCGALSRRKLEMVCECA